MTEQLTRGRGVYGWAGWSTLAFVALGCSAPSESATNEPTPELESRSGSQKRSLPEAPAFDSRLVVKFQDHLRIRAEPDGNLRSEAAESAVGELETLARQYGLRFSQHIQLPATRLQALEAEAELVSGEAQPDLAAFVDVDVAEERVQEAAEALQASPLTEFVYFAELEPPPPQLAHECRDIDPETPSYTSRQTYYGPAGLNMTAAWAIAPTRGAGVGIADCEYGYNPSHEDLCGVIPEPGQIVASPFGLDHGTMVLGVLLGSENAYGCTGLVPEAKVSFFSESTAEQPNRRVGAIASAIAAASAGDVVLLEMQATGPGKGLGPAEIDPAVWSVVKLGTSKGMIVVAAAGNGLGNGAGNRGEDLDSSLYAEYRARGDSGAIIVGAGTPNAAHDAYGYSTFGKRVNVQAWGGSIFTLGVGDFAKLGGDENQAYTDNFGGTSGASALVAAAAAALQGVADTYLGRRLTPLEMRKLLIATGTPQGSGKHIGPIPNVAAAASAIMAGDPCGDGTCGQ